MYTIVTKIQIRLCTLIWDPNTHHTYLVMEERQDTAKVSNTVAKGAKRTTKVKQNAYGKREYKKIYLKKTHVQSNTQFRNTTSYKVDKKKVTPKSVSHHKNSSRV